MNITKNPAALLLAMSTTKKIGMNVEKDARELDFGELAVSTVERLSIGRSDNAQTNTRTPFNQGQR